MVVRAEITAGAQRLAHVAEAERTGVHVVVEQQRDLLVAGVSRQIACAQTGIGVHCFHVFGAHQKYRAAERVRIRHDHRALRAVNFKACVVLRGIVHVKRREHLRNGAVRERDVAGEVRIGLHVDLFAVVWLGGDQTLFKRLFRHSRYTDCLADELHERRHVIRAHVHHWTAASFIEEIRVRVPCLRAVLNHCACRTDDIADQPVINNLARGLDACAHERIRCAAHEEIFLLCERHQLCAFLHVRRKRLFREHMLAVLQRGFRHAIVLIRAGKVQNNLHFGIVECFIHILVNFRHGGFCACFNVFLHRLHAFFRALRDEVAYADELHLFKYVRDIFKVNAADGADADHCNLYGICVCHKIHS